MLPWTSRRLVHIHWRAPTFSVWKSKASCRKRESQASELEQVDRGAHLGQQRMGRPQLEGGQWLNWVCRLMGASELIRAGARGKGKGGKGAEGGPFGVPLSNWASPQMAPGCKSNGGSDTLIWRVGKRKREREKEVLFLCMERECERPLGLCKGVCLALARLPDLAASLRA